jgi:hypothetical protein
MSRERATVHERMRAVSRSAYKTLKNDGVTIVGIEGNERVPRGSRQRWLRGRDSNPNFLVQSQASYR